MLVINPLVQELSYVLGRQYNHCASPNVTIRDRTKELRKATMSPTLSQIVQKKKAQASGIASIDWNDRRDTYIAAVADLYNQIEQILGEPICQKEITLQRRAKQLSESYIGTYSVDDLILLIGDEQVRFSPRGRNIVGASGRVDVLGDRGEAALVVQVDGRWGFVQSPQPTLRVILFDESTLAELLQLVMRD